MINQNQAQDIDISNCDKEPIHIPGAIQPYGVLLVLNKGVVFGVSSNADELLGISAEKLQGQLLTNFIDIPTCDYIQNTISQGAINQVSCVEVHWNTKNSKESFDGILHQNKNGMTILELEPKGRYKFSRFSNLNDIIGKAFIAIQMSRDLNEFSQNIVKMVRFITGFDHVMLYQFDRDWHGHVIAEDKDDSRHSYLNHHFPASDIPAQARELYRTNWLRFILDVSYQASTIKLKETTNPLDLSFSTLRSVSPIHIEYLKNMSVGASMSISIIKEGNLWGLIACHHAQSLYIPYNIRNACVLLGEIFSIELASKEQEKRNIALLNLKEITTKLIEQIILEDDIAEGLVRISDSLMDIMESQGIALYLDQRLRILGQTPGKEKVGVLIEWLIENNKGNIFVSQCLADDYPAANEFANTASGILVIPISKLENDFIVLFRPEYVQNLVWAGNPNKSVSIQQGKIKISPRDSFASYKEIVKLRSLPWEQAQVEAAGKIGETIAKRMNKRFELDYN